MKTQPFLWRWKGAPLALLVTVLGIGGLRAGGLLQGLEWWAYDRFLRATSQPNPAKERVVVVGITEADIRKYRFPIDDATLARTLETILAHQPRAIGLNLLRDFPVGPGYGELVATLQANPEIVGVTFVGGEEDESIPPPPALPPDRVAASDLIGDADGTIRRAQLYPAGVPAIGLQLAAIYLRQEGMADRESPNGWLQFSDVEITPLRKNAGFYIGAPQLGYQILLPYRGRDAFQAITLQDTLAGNFPPSFFQNRIVIIGTTAPSARNEYLTPYSRGLGSVSPQGMPGTLVHAQVSAGLLEAVLGDRALIQTIAEPVEYFWILAWCGVQGLILSRWHNVRLRWVLPTFTGSAVILSAAVLGIGYCCFVCHWWVPVMPPILAIATVATLGTIANLVVRTVEYQNILQNRLLLQEPEVQLGRLAGALDHEIRGALQYILNGAQFTQAMLGEPEMGFAVSPEIARLIYQNLDAIDTNVLTIIETLQALLQPDARDLVSINATISRLDRIVSYYFRTECSFSPTCKFDLDPDLDLPAVPLYISPAVANLLRNAYEALQEVPSPQLTVTTRRHRDYISIRVTDNGPGIPPKDREQIFSFRASSKGGQHCGLGLHLARNLVERAGGSLAVTCPPSGGSIFLIELPTRES